MQECIWASSAPRLQSPLAASRRQISNGSPDTHRAVEARRPLPLKQIHSGSGSPKASPSRGFRHVNNARLCIDSSSCRCLPSSRCSQTSASFLPPLEGSRHSNTTFEGSLDVGLPQQQGLQVFHAPLTPAPGQPPPQKPQKICTFRAATRIQVYDRPQIAGTGRSVLLPLARFASESWALRAWCDRDAAALLVRAGLHQSLAFRVLSASGPQNPFNSGIWGGGWGKRDLTSWPTTLS